jgi:D-alanyl-lipoteichoic acid acyltransferase DltB (MBOAT superfamily)
MLFNSLQYILFVLIVVSTFWVLSRLRMMRVLLLLFASWLFYMSWSPIYIGLIIGSTIWDYCLGMWIHRSQLEWKRKLFVTMSVVGNLGLLGLFKYFNFFMKATEDVARVVGGVTIDLPFLDVLLPVGISFYTFQTMSYTIDIYRREMEPTRNFFHFATFVAFFPQLVAGPIVRAKDFLPQLEKPPRVTRAMVGTGLFFIACGLVKKVGFADYVAVNLVDRVFENPANFTATEVMVALYGYTVQIYCDFSGYSDVAIGTGLLMGLQLPDNFDRPYMSTNPAEFWRRWHMTLSTWLRDYLYFPLGGSKKGPIRTYVNLFLTLYLIGIWHGASWVFVLYGLTHASAMVIHRFFYKRSGRSPDTLDRWQVHVFKVALMFHFTVLSRILFRGTSLDNVSDVTRQLFAGTSSLANVSAGVWAAILVAMLIHWTPRRWADAVQHRFVSAPAWAQGVALAAVAAVLLQVATDEVVPYIYFQF